jgi:ParB family chromosome partitioning protein
MLGKLISNSDQVNRLLKIDVNQIVPNPDQPRKIFEKRSIEELAQSIQAYGIIQPLIVRHIPNGQYELVAGERRFQAAKLAGLRSVPCVLSNMERKDSAVIALVENIQRQDLSFFEEAYAIEKLMKHYFLTQDQVAKRLGKNQSTIANKLRLLKLSPEIKRKIVNYGLTERHARALLRIPEEGEQLTVVNEVIQKKLSVSQTEQRVEKILDNHIQSYGQRKSKPIACIKDIRIFINTLNHAVNIMKTSGVLVQAEKKEDADFIEYSIRIPKNTA